MASWVKPLLLTPASYVGVQVWVPAALLLNSANVSGWAVDDGSSVFVPATYVENLELLTHDLSLSLSPPFLVFQIDIY